MTAAASPANLAPGARLFLRLSSAAALIWALMLLADGGAVHALYGGALGALALRGFAVALAGSRGSSWLLPLDFAILVVFGFANRPDLALWAAPVEASDLLRLSQPATVAASLIYAAAALIGLALHGRRAGARASLALLALPFLFNLLFVLGAPLLDRLAADLPLPGAIAKFLLRGALLFVVNEAVIYGACVAEGRRAAGGLGLRLLLLAAAYGAAATPFIAEAGALPFLAKLPAVLRIPLAALAAAGAQAGLWAEVYLVTGALGDIVHGAPPVAPRLAKFWRSGGAKGAVYGGVFVFLLMSFGAFTDTPLAVSLFLGSSYLGAALAGAGLFPLARTIMESTDSTPPFVLRLRNAYRQRSNYISGVVVGAGMALGFALAMPHAAGGARFLFGFGIGALAYCAALATSDLSDMGRGLRARPRPWRPYALAILLGGVVAGAIGWYFDQGQIDVIVAHFRDHVVVNYPAAGRSELQYAITPFFSKWGATQMGLVQGGVKLLYLESLSGVIQWIFAAPLFSINLFFLTALMKRDLAPIKMLFSAQGMAKLADNAIVVLRWGLWMAPIIYAFLKVSPTPEWYNQDGLVRSTVATFMSAALPPSQFRDWSLAVFTALLTFDWLRILIWFDHMGLRVATLVNLSFVGGDMADEGSARFLGAQGRGRAIPEAMRRFGTWAPLLIPFYIPRGAEWDKAWTGAEAARAVGLSPLGNVLIGYALFALGLSAVLALFTLTRSRARSKDAAQPSVLSNGLLSQEIWPDGQNFIRVETAARRGQAIDMTRVVDDPILPRGGFVYFAEETAGEAPLLWSLAPAPTGAGFGAFQALSPLAAELRGELHDLRCEARVDLAPSEAFITTKITLRNLGVRPRKLRIATYRDWVMNEGWVERRDAPYNALHVGTFFARPLGAIFARNRLLKNESGDFAAKRLSREIAFHAVQPSERVRLIGYEDVRSRFFGLGQRRDPDVFKQGLTLRDPADEGLLYGFDPCAALMLEVELPADGAVEITLVDGWASDEKAAAKLLSRQFGVEWSEAAQAEVFSRHRALLPAITPPGERFAFSGDGRAVQTPPGAPRPFGHVLANALGLGIVASHDGDLYSFHRNARANALTPFRMGEGRNAPPGQAVFVTERENGETHCATLLPLRRADTAYDCVFTQAAVTYRSDSPRLALEQKVFVAPDEAVQVILLTLRNKGDRAQTYRVASLTEMVLAETPPESVGALRVEADSNGRALYFYNPRNDFVRDWIFVAASFDADCAEAVRARAIGAAPDPRVPFIALHGHSDGHFSDDGRRAAGFTGLVTVPAGGEASVSIALGAASSLEAAQSLANRAATPEFAAEKQALAEKFWETMCSTLRIETNRPDFDRLVNDWLPYQLLAARLWGRTGPSQRSGAYGYRDQLQDVLPLAAIAPELARKQILLHASQQFVEGDVLKWWHESPEGGVCIAERNHASDPHLWLPYVTTRYVAATGDATILHELAPFVEGPAVPPGVEGYCFPTLPSEEKATVLEHCRRSIDYALSRFGKNGLPLMGVGDWDDGMNLVGIGGKGESVWVGFFLYDILTRFAALLDAQGDVVGAAEYAGKASALTYALDACWRGDRYVRAFADDGQEFLPIGAMSSAWPALSGAAQSERGRKALENALSELDKGDRVLLVTPPYDENSKPFPGRSADYPPGVRENGGQYTHGSSWFVDALTRLGEKAAREGDAEQAARDYSRAFEVWLSLSPLTKTTPDKIDLYGLPPHQQPADVYDGPGYEGRGGWSWYSGAAARMISAAHALLGVNFANGELRLRADSFDEKAGLRLKSVTYKGKTFVAEEVKETAPA